MFIVVGTNHRYSPIEIRERLYLSQKDLKEILTDLMENRKINSGVILSTCNRIEVYVTCKDLGWGVSVLRDFFRSYGLRQGLVNIDSFLYTYINKEAMRHLFEVASGVDSQIIGETQILEQVRSAWLKAKIWGATDRLLDIIFEKAIETSLKVREKTNISRGKVSIGSVVIEIIKTRYSLLSDKRILIIGVGKISELVIRYLRGESAKAVFIANRTYERACKLADYINAEALRFDGLRERLKDADIIISATSSPHLILKKEDILEVINHRLSTIDHRPILIIDIAVPRDVDPEVKGIKGIELFDLESLNFLIEKNLEKRKKEIPYAKQVIEEELARIWEGFIVSEPELALLP